MNRSFFHYLMTLRGGGTHDALSVFATEAGKDIQFPKHSSSYEEISNYLELNVDYLPSMDIFDEAWEKYLENNHDIWKIVLYFMIKKVFCPIA
ncbi:YozE family protein [Enterococcus faecium]|nr:YozE family protein [Enterococcus faecium]BDP46217.1 UPF0346 protein [Enterococcus faecium]